MPEIGAQQRVDRLEIAMEQLIRQVDITSTHVAHLSREIDRLSKQIDEFKDEMDKFREEMGEFKGEMRRESKEFREDLVEDIVAPTVPEVIKRHFDMEIEFMGIRMRRRMGELKGEYGVIAMADGTIFIVEVKSRFNIEYVRQFGEKLAKFRDLFPKYGDRRIVGIIVSLRLDGGGDRAEILRYGHEGRIHGPDKCRGASRAGMR